MGGYEVEYAAQLIDPIGDIAVPYGNPPIIPGGTATSGLPVGYASSDNSIAEAYQDAADGDAWKIRILRTGVVTITASQPGDPGYYLPADAVTFKLTVNQRPVKVGFTAGATLETERKSDVKGTSVSVSVARGGRRIHKKKQKKQKTT